MFTVCGCRVEGQLNSVLRTFAALNFITVYLPYTSVFGLPADGIRKRVGFLPRSAGLLQSSGLDQGEGGGRRLPRRRRNQRVSRRKSRSSN